MSSRFSLYVGVVIRGALDILPCAECGLPGPHAFRIQRELGITALCPACAAKEAPEGAREDQVDACHTETLRPAIAAAY